ncbi:unnamed protein product, partial [Pelagomonas calceolata]
VGERNVRDAVVTLCGVFVICACVRRTRGAWSRWVVRSTRAQLPAARRPWRRVRRRCNFFASSLCDCRLRCSARCCDATRLEVATHAHSSASACVDSADRR